MSRSVEAEEKDKQRRRRNVTVCGLKPSENVDDALLFLNFCSKHLNISPSICREKCCRIDRPQTNRIQRLLIVCNSESTRDELLAAGKLLRSSTDEYVRRTVYIDPDLTPSEEKQAFEARQKHRERQRSASASRQQSKDRNQSAETAVDRRNRPTSRSQSAAIHTPSVSRYHLAVRTAPASAVCVYSTVTHPSTVMSGSLPSTSVAIVRPTAPPAALVVGEPILRTEKHSSVDPSEISVMETHRMLGASTSTSGPSSGKAEEPPPTYDECTTVMAAPGGDAVPSGLDSTWERRYHRHFKCTFALAIIACIFNPCIGPFAVWLANSAEKYGRSPSEESQKCSRPRRRCSICLSALSLVITTVVVTLIALTFTVFTVDSYPYSFNTTIEECGFGVYSSGKCYYDARYEASVGDTKICNKPGSELAPDGFCYHVTAPKCKHAHNYMNDICYPYRLKSTPDHCIHGFPVSGFCYYDARVPDVGSVCDGYDADVSGSGFCYGSSHHACRFTAVFANSICYTYRKLSTSAAGCLHGHSLGGHCYYDKRYSGQPTCRGDADKFDDDAFCYYSSSALCQHSTNFANGICYPYIIPSSAENCIRGYYTPPGYCYYDNRYFRSGSVCTEGGADANPDGFCYNSSSIACPYTKTYVIGTCYSYRLLAPIDAICLHGFYDDGQCFYDSRYRDSYFGNCNAGNADGYNDGFCYFSSLAVCSYARNYANKRFYDYLVPTRSKYCPMETYGNYYFEGYCYCINPCRLSAASSCTHINLLVIVSVGLSLAVRFVCYL